MIIFTFFSITIRLFSFYPDCCQIFVCKFLSRFFLCLSFLVYKTVYNVAYFYRLKTWWWIKYNYGVKILLTASNRFFNSLRLSFAYFVLFSSTTQKWNYANKFPWNNKSENSAYLFFLLVGDKNSLIVFGY